MRDRGLNGQLAMKWIGHATVLIEMDGRRILTDPVLRGRIGPLRRYGPPVQSDWYSHIDVALISHLHRDHLDIPSLRLLGPDTLVVVPRGAREFVNRHGFNNVRELCEGETLTVSTISIQATPAVHGGLRPPFGPTASPVGYSIWGSHRIYFPGDTALFPGMTALAKDLDVALLPVGGWWSTLRGGHLNPQTAADSLVLLNPKVAIPIHWGTLWPIGLRSFGSSKFDLPGREFVARSSAVAPHVEVYCLPVGGEIHLQTFSAERSRS